ncbi:MAG: hypothetical protein CMB80_17940 [Flammeovirgaceae bacterium]|nr:hypothetical protein [Flammeovirgaceae bacterium]MBR06719.1 hypothetical protein [Rickettsiales bacterium]|tara:strand:+ start:3915 stop:4367 length:453 start_codon:yes stop_codon:yes gene_type:complete
MLKPLLLAAGLFVLMNFGFGQNLTVYRSEKGVEQTVAKLIEVIKTNEELIYFETVSHDEIARERGMELDSTRSILFEEPNLTTQLLQCQPTAALDLPLEIIVWEEYGDVYIGFMDPKFMKRRFMITDCEETIVSLTSVMTKVTMDALRQL